MLAQDTPARDSLIHSEAGFRLVADRYFSHPMLKLEGVDGIGQKTDERDRVTHLTFPIRFAAVRSRFDMQLTFHEMGHAVSLPARRIVRPGFGFSGGIPDLDWEYWRDVNDVAISHIPESMAFAWEHILLEDVFGISIPVRRVVESLRHAPDFYLYEGKGDNAKLDWVAEMTAAKVEEYRAGPSFETLWAERMALLPSLIALENERLDALDAPPVDLSEPQHVHQDWQATIGRHEFGQAKAWRVLLEETSNGEGLARDFDTQAAAERWIARIQNNYTQEPEACSGPKP